MAILRSAFFLLILANLLVFAWAQGYFGGRDTGREPGRVADQLHPDSMTVRRAEKDDLKPKPAAVCRLVDGLSAGDAEQVRAALEDKGEGGDGLIVSLAQFGRPGSHVVAISGLAGRQAADKKAGELRALGVAEFTLAEDMKTGVWSIVLGSFQSEAAAGEFLAGLNRRGVKSARVEVREKPAELVRLEVRGAAELVARRLPMVLAGTAGVSVGDCH